MDEVRCIAPMGDRCGEAATWCVDEQALYFVDVNRFLIHRLDRHEAVRTWFFDEPVAALAETDVPGRWLVALASGLVLWQPADDTRRLHGFSLPSAPAARLNDGRAGPGGEFWIGSMSHNVGRAGEALAAVAGLGELFRIGVDRAATVFRRDVGISNTICWSPDAGTFYFGDTLRNVIWAFDYDCGSMAIGNERVHFEGFDRGHPDGSAVDADGYLWNARFGGGCVVRVAPDGSVDRVVEVPARNPTTCAFGGADLRTLYITSAAMMTTESDRLAGSLFALRTDVPGLTSYRVKL